MRDDCRSPRGRHRPYRFGRRAERKANPQRPARASPRCPQRRQVVARTRQSRSFETIHPDSGAGPRGRVRSIHGTQRRVRSRDGNDSRGEGAAASVHGSVAARPRVGARADTDALHLQQDPGLARLLGAYPSRELLVVAVTQRAEPGAQRMAPAPSAVHSRNRAGATRRSQGDGRRADATRRDSGVRWGQSLGLA